MVIARSRLANAACGGTYEPPALLHEIHLLDILELSGSQHAAAGFLAMHQSTVSRAVKGLQRQLALRPGRRVDACREGRNACLDQLRLACRAHRLMHGVLRIGTDALHQALLSRQVALQQVPPRFRRLDQWAELVRLGLLDGAIVSSYGLDAPMPQGRLPRWSGITVEPLGALPLQLMACVSNPKAVLLPSRSTTPLLHQALEQAGHQLMLQPLAGQEPAAWLKRMRDRDLALPLCPGLAGRSWLHEQALCPLPQQVPLLEELYLLLPALRLPAGRPPAGNSCHPLERQWATRLRRVVGQAARKQEQSDPSDLRS